MKERKLIWIIEFLKAVVKTKDIRRRLKTEGKSYTIDELKKVLKID